MRSEFAQPHDSNKKNEGRALFWDGKKQEIAIWHELAGRSMR
jgi:hypothetical protein